MNLIDKIKSQPFFLKAIKKTLIIFIILGFVLVFLISAFSFKAEAANMTSTPSTSSISEQNSILMETTWWSTPPLDLDRTLFYLFNASGQNISGNVITSTEINWAATTTLWGDLNNRVTGGWQPSQAGNYSVETISLNSPTLNYPVYVPYVNSLCGVGATLATCYSDFVSHSSSTIFLGSSPLNNALSIYNPLDGQVMTDFQNWIIIARYLPTSTSQLGTVIINYSRFSSSTFEYSDKIIIGSTFGSTLNNARVYILKSRDLWHIPMSPQGVTWYAKAKLYNSNILFNSSTFLAESNLSTFVVTSQVGAYDPSATGTLADTAGYQDCSLIDSGFLGIGGPELWVCYISNGLTGLVRYLFYPTPDALGFFNEQFDNFKTKFPFNIVFNLASTTQDMLEVGSSTISGSNYNTYITLNGSNIQLINSSTLNIIGTTTKNKLFQIISAFAWLMAGFVIFKMITRPNS